ncbi:hypothetical protein SNEBB_004677 [Seison nebaliae]|nr:hypothetical protein SNEBB_004677 [Seison nebaliae]
MMRRNIPFILLISGFDYVDGIIGVLFQFIPVIYIFHNRMKVKRALILNEGKRPPLTTEGRSLPSHGRYQLDSTAGGFIIGSFLTGITPQDFFFHCQAGREGLIDTAIKTSRSGYLQRSLVKHLEGLVVQYDYTVRDSDGSVIQFLYGEDSIDVLKSAFLNVNSFPFLIDNARVYLDSMFLINRLRLESPPDFNTIRHHWKCFHQLLQDQHLCYDEYDARILPFFHLNFLQLDTYDNFLLRIIDYDTLLERFRPTSSLDCISDKMDHMLNTYIEENEHAFRNSNMINPEDFLNLMKFKISNSFVEPGDAVGLLAAQSIGEPSTQMTLNTFHFAGRGEMNVTLGIPRLREILMVASANLKTPNMSVPVYNSYSAQLYARYLQKLSKRVTVCDMLTSLKMDRCVQTINGYLTTTYNMHLLFRPETEWDEVGYCGNSDQLFTYMTFFFLKYFIRAVKAKIHRIRRLGIFQSKDSRIVAGNELDQKEVIEEAHQMTKKPKMIHLDQMELTKLKEENLSEDDDDDDDYDLYSDSDFDDDDDADYLAKKAKKLDKNRRRKEVESANMKKLREKGGTKYTDEQLSITSNLDFVTKVKVVRGKNPDENSFFNFHLQIDNTNPFVDMFDLMKLIMSKAAVQQIPGIGQSFMKETERGLTFIAEGDDLKELMKYYSCFDFTRVHTNNIHVMAKFFGIEAANRVLIEEIFQVFAVYGIKVDHRHLSLIADYMTFHGVYKPLNRSGMQCCPSAIQRMTYEGTGQFLSSSLLRGESDFMQSPSSRLCTGRSVNVGTGLCACVNEVE